MVRTNRVINKVSVLCHHVERRKELWNMYKLEFDLKEVSLNSRRAAPEDPLFREAQEKYH